MKMIKNTLALGAIAALGLSGQAVAGGCSTDAWSSTSEQGNTTISAEARAGFEGSCVLAVNKPGGDSVNQSGFVRYDFASAEPTLRGRFVIDPTNMSFSGTTGGELRGRVLDIRRPSGTALGQLFMSMLVRDQGGTFQGNVKIVGGPDSTGTDRARFRATNPWFDLANGPNNIQFEIDFETAEGADDGQVRILLDGVEVGVTSNGNIGVSEIDNIRLGNIRGFVPAYSGETVFDAVELRRQTTPGNIQ